MVVIVTKENQEMDTDDEFRDEFIEMQVTLDESEHILYEFATLDDVINLSNRLYNLGVTGGKLYTWDGRFIFGWKKRANSITESGFYSYFSGIW